MSFEAPQEDPREKALVDLEWSQIAQAVFARLSGEPEPSDAAERTLPLAQSEEGMRRALGETAEALACLREGEPLPLTGLRAVATHLLRLQRQGALDAPALNDLRSVLAAARVLRRFLARRREHMPLLSEACGFDASLDGLQASLDAAFDSDGTLSSHASADLRRLRTETHNLRARLIGRLESLVHEKADLLSDRFYTEREGRYVLPVRADAHERVHGIVHGASSSGATIFVEPRALITAGNRLKLAQAEQAREEARILAELSELVRERLAAVRAAYEALRWADLRAACAKLSDELGGVMPVTDTRVIDLREARHPLLVLDGVEVVSNDVALEPARALIISGPNAGGKTVALKLLGLAALMARAGLFLPAAEGSRCGFFDPVLSDVGDEQSLTRNLSTFSAHVTRLRAVLEAADSHSLVLLDELAGSTDPEEGAALACALVERLCQAGSAVAVTTHYEPLKGLATRAENMQNASVGFDVARLAPTFRLRTGIPGASSALAVAERFGIPSNVVGRAREILPENARAFESLIRELETRAEALESEREEAARLTREAERLRAEAERREAALAQRDQKALSKHTEQLVAELREARTEVDDARKVLRRKKLDEAQLQKAREKLAAAEQKAQAHTAVERDAEAEPRDKVDSEQLGPGTRVYVPRLRAEAEVVEGPTKGQLRVAAGALKLWVSLDELREAQAAERAKAKGEKKRAAAAPPEPAERAVLQTPDTTVDVRGMTVDDATQLLETFLDRLYGQDRAAAFVVHGLGSGALRDGIRRWLARPSRYVREFRPGSREEGGDAVTVVLLH